MEPGGIQAQFLGFVGRRRELSELRHALDEAREGHGRLFLISGEPGIGKTRIAEEIAQDVNVRGMRAVWGRCWEGDGAPPYWPWIQIIRECLDTFYAPERRSSLASDVLPAIETVARILPELRAPSSTSDQPEMAPDIEQARFKLFDAVSLLLKSFARVIPLAIIVDDIHDADDASLAMLRFAAHELRAAPILFVATYRELEMRRSPQLTKHVGDLARDSQSIPLMGLSREEVAEFIARNSHETPKAELVSRAHEATGGNPLFLDGVVRMLAADGEASSQVPTGDFFRVPDTVHEAIRRRLSVLSVETRETLDIASVIGNEFEVDLLARVTHRSRDGLELLVDEAARQGIVASLGNGRRRFAHALVRGVIYDELKSDDRARFHHGIGESIEDLYGQDLEPYVTELAHHFREAKLNSKAIDYSIRSGDAANGVGANAEAVLEWQRALSLMEAQGVEAAPRAELMKRVGSALHPIDQPASVKYRKSAIELYESVGLWQEAAIVRVQLGRAFAIAGQPITNTAHAIEQLRLAEQTLAQGPETSWVAWMYEGIAAYEQQSLNLAACTAAARRGMEIGARLSDRCVWSPLAAFDAFVQALGGRLREAFAQFDLAFEAADEADTPGSGHCATNLAAWCCNWLGDPREARSWFERELYRPRNANFLWARHDLSQSVAATYFEEGQIHDLLESVGAEDPGVRFWVGGEWDTIARWVEDQAKSCERANDRVAFLHWRLMAGLAFSYLGDFARSEAHFQRGLDRGSRGTIAIHEMRVRPFLSLAYAEMNRLVEAAAEFARCREIMAAGEDWRGSAGHVARAEGVVAAKRGQFDLAFRHFESALAIHRKYHLAEQEGETLRFWGRALAAAGDRASANEKYDASKEVSRARGVGPRFIEFIEADRMQALGNATTFAVSPQLLASLKLEGEFWTITYQGSAFRLRKIKGLSYLAHLLAHPGEPFHSKDLVRIIEGPSVEPNFQSDIADSRLRITNDLDGAPVRNDPRARTEYRARIQELKADLDVAQRNNDLGRVEFLRQELEFLTDEIASVSGIRGRIRQSSPHAERARVMVKKSLRGAIEKIRRESPALARHLSNAIRTGYFCSYEPDRDHPVSWQL